ncbi:MAG: DNA integrity scanning diadenylate cyclase DisA [Nanoarchaeota archaeon]
MLKLNIKNKSINLNRDKEDKELPNSDTMKEKLIEKDSLLEKGALIEAEEEQKQLTKLDILKKMSSGTELRNGVNDIVRGKMGGIIVFANSRVYGSFQGGFKVNCKFSAKRIVELAKMDGAIIISEDSKKILYANTLLIPDSSLSSSETGIRHQAAERTARQTGALVIAVSQRRGEITIFYGNYKYVLKPTEDLLRRATETLQILEKQREIFNEILTNLNILELTNLVSVGDVCKILQRIEMIKKMASIINEYIIELGKDGVILRMRLREIIRGIERENELIIKDYIQRSNRAKQFLENLNFEEILDLENIAFNLFKEPLDKEILPIGYRILDRTSLTDEEINGLAKELGSLDSILNADDDVLINLLGVKGAGFKKEISNLKEQILIGKRV